MAAKIVPPVALGELRRDLNNPTLAIYLVVGREQSDAWLTGESVIADMARSHAYLLTRASDANDWNDSAEASGWPEGTAWGGGEPVGICFGFGNVPRIYLTREQAEDVVVVGAAHARAQELGRL